MIYKDFATLLVNLNLGANEIPTNISKGTLITDVLGVLRNNNIISLGHLKSISYDHKSISIIGSDDSELQNYSYEDLPAFNTKDELVDFITQLLKTVAYK